MECSLLSFLTILQMTILPTEHILNPACIVCSSSLLTPAYVTMVSDPHCQLRSQIKVYLQCVCDCIPGAMRRFGLSLNEELVDSEPKQTIGKEGLCRVGEVGPQDWYVGTVVPWSLPVATCSAPCLSLGELLFQILPSLCCSASPWAQHQRSQRAWTETFPTASRRTSLLPEVVYVKHSVTQRDRSLIKPSASNQI